MTAVNNNIYVGDNRPSESDIILEVGLPVTMYGSYYSVPGTIISVDKFKSGAQAGRVKSIVVAQDEYMGEDNWNTRLDITKTYKVKYLIECAGNRCGQFNKCRYCSGTRYLFVSVNGYGQVEKGSYGKTSWRGLGLGFREDYHDYTSEFYLSV